MIRNLTLALLGATMLVSPALAADPAPVPASALVKEVNIPHQQFTLKNGLRVIVHTDRKAPVVAVSIWYDIGSKHEPKGKTGFAHLFEHLMFSGSENVPSFDEATIALGGANNNGSTSFDRTNYVETVPTGALEKMLYIESDRMGYLLGAVTQENLTNQIGVVQNEKRQGDTQPYGLVEYAQIEGTLPDGHPYGHSPIGSMADLDGASLEDVRAWFRQHYGPNNAVLVLAGDIDVPTAKKLVEKNFGAIKAGPKQKPPKVEVPTLAAPKFEVMKDKVATTRIYRNWTVPGIDSADSVPLEVGAAVLGGLASSRLDNILVRQEKLAVSVTAGYQGFAQLGAVEISANVTPGVDPSTVAKRLDEVIADFVKTGPTTDEVQRVQMRIVSGRIAGLEEVGGFGGKAVTLAEGALYRNDSNFYKKQLEQLSKITPMQVTGAIGRWLKRPVFALMVEPGERAPYEEAKGAPKSKADSAPIATVKRSPAPELGMISDLAFPKVERTKLSNGIEIVYAQRNAVPLSQVSLSFNAGNTADPRDRSGTQSLMLALLDEGAAGMTSTQIAEAQERLGASIGSSASMDRTNVNVTSLSANLAPSLKLFSDIVLRPDFVPAEVERLRGQQLARIQSELTSPQGVAFRTLPPILFGKDHPYGISFTGTGEVATVSKVSREEILDFHHKWFRPEKATFFVVSDKPLAEIKSALESSFGSWTATGPAGIKDMSAAPAAANPRIILINRRGSPQSLILGGQVLATKGTADLETAITANEALGAGFLSRINMDLRETKGWSYGVRGSINRVEGDVPYLISAPVQADKTGESIAALISNYKAFLSDKGITKEERDRIVGGNIRELPGSFETSGDVLSAMQRNVLFKRPDDFYATVASEYRDMTEEKLDGAVRALVNPDKFTWVVVGDAAKVKPQLEALGLPIEMVTEAANTSANNAAK